MGFFVKKWALRQAFLMYFSFPSKCNFITDISGTYNPHYIILKNEKYKSYPALAWTLP